MPRSHRLAALCTAAIAAAALCASACSNGHVDGAKDEPQKPWQPLDPNPGGNGELKPSYGRLARRLSVDQLRQSIPVLFHGIKWTDSKGRDLFNVMSRTLGEADYVDMTKSNTEVTALFMKFMDDMAGHVCKKAIAADLDEIQKQGDTSGNDSGAVGLSTRRIIRYPTDVDRTLRWLRLKFHAVSAKAASANAALRKLYDTVLNSAAAPGDNNTTDAAKSKAWEAVCIAVLTDPEFFAY